MNMKEKTVEGIRLSGCNKNKTIVTIWGSVLSLPYLNKGGGTGGKQCF